MSKTKLSKMSKTKNLDDKKNSQLFKNNIKNIYNLG